MNTRGTVGDFVPMSRLDLKGRWEGGPCRKEDVHCRKVSECAKGRRSIVERCKKVPKDSDQFPVHSVPSPFPGNYCLSASLDLICGAHCS